VSHNSEPENQGQTPSPASENERLIDIERQLEEDPGNQGLLLEASRYYHRYAMQGDELALDRADQSTKRLLKLDRRNVEGMAIAGSLLTIKARRSGSLLKRIWYSILAARKLDKAVETDPTNVSARTIRAFTALVLPGFLRRLRTAVLDFEYLAEMKDKNPTLLPDEMMPKVFLNLGLAYAKLRDRERAKQVLTYVIDSFPGTRERNRAKSLLDKLADRGW
jgi:tetratricopeptide (TPR) repeat protein